VLDDPLSALDVHTESLVQDQLRPLLATSTCSWWCTARPPWRWPTGRSCSTPDASSPPDPHADLLEREPRYRAVLSEGRCGGYSFSFLEALYYNLNIVNLQYLFHFHLYPPLFIL
jgi:ATP-binding cassette subfamily B protein